MKKRVFILSSILTLTMSVTAFAGPTHSFSVGADLGGEPHIDTSDEVLTVARNLVYAGYTPQIVITDLGDNRITYDWLNSGVVYLAGHGSGNGQDVIWRNSATGLYYSVSTNNLSSGKGRTVNKGTYPNCKLAIISACYCGSPNGVAQAFQKYGADCAFGWTDEVDDKTLAAFNKHVTAALADNATVQQAIKEAVAAIPEDPDLIVYDERVFDYKTYGSGVYNTIKRDPDPIPSSTFNELNMLLDVSGYDPDTYQRPTSEFSDLRDFNIKYEGGDDTQIVKYIQENLDSQFDSSLFDFDEIEIIPGDHSSLMLIYNYKIGDVISDFGYMVNIENNSVVGIKQIGEPIYDYPSLSEIDVNQMEKEKLQVYQQQPTTISDSLKNQEIGVRFDSENKEYIYYVDSVYETDDGGIYATRTVC